MYDKYLKIQQELGAIKKDSTNPYFQSKYFDINALLSHVKPVLNKHGVILIQCLTNVGGKNALDTKLVDVETKVAIGAEPIVLPDYADAQKAGSAITYFRRYAIQTILALEAEDDDGNLQSEKEQTVKKTKVVKITTDNNEDVPF